MQDKKELRAAIQNPKYPFIERAFLFPFAWIWMWFDELPENDCFCCFPFCGWFLFGPVTGWVASKMWHVPEFWPDGEPRPRRAIEWNPYTYLIRRMTR